MVFKYQHLPNLCYWCGCLNHDDKDGEGWIQSKGTLQSSQQQFGPSLRAFPYKTFNNSVILVPGIFENRSSQRRKFVSDEAAPPSTVVEVDTNSETAEVQADMETKKSGGELIVDNSSDLNSPSVTQVTLHVTTLAHDLSDTIPQHLPLFNTDVTQMDSNLLFKLAENKQETRKSEQVPSNTTGPLMSHVTDMKNQTKERVLNQISIPMFSISNQTLPFCHNKESGHAFRDQLSWRTMNQMALVLCWAKVQRKQVFLHRSYLTRSFRFQRWMIPHQL